MGDDAITHKSQCEGNYGNQRAHGHSVNTARLSLRNRGTHAAALTPSLKIGAKMTVAKSAMPCNTAYQTALNSCAVAYSSATGKTYGCKLTEKHKALIGEDFQVWHQAERLSKDGFCLNHLCVWGGALQYL